MNEVLIAAIAAACGAILAALGRVIVDVIKTKGDIQKEEDDRLEERQIAYIDKLQEEISSIRKEFTELDNSRQMEIRSLMIEHARCREENAVLRERVIHLEKQVNSIQIEVKNGTNPERKPT